MVLLRIIIKTIDITLPLSQVRSVWHNSVWLWVPLALGCEVRNEFIFILSSFINLNPLLTNVICILNKIIIVADNNIKLNFLDLIFAISQNTVSFWSKGIESTCQDFKNHINNNEIIWLLNWAWYLITFSGRCYPLSKHPKNGLFYKLLILALMKVLKCES